MLSVEGETLNPKVSNFPFEKIMFSPSLEDDLSAASTNGVMVHVWNGPSPHVRGLEAIVGDGDKLLWNKDTYGQHLRDRVCIIIGRRSSRFSLTFVSKTLLLCFEEA